ncbi:MAG: 50S ribosomal protein L10 [bacterium]
MKKLAKTKIVEELKKRYNDAAVTFIFKNKGLTVSEMTNVRKKLKEVGVDVKVAKNTLSKIAVEGTDYSSLKEYLQGPTVTLWGYNDPVPPAKALSTFLKEQPKAEFVVGAIKGRIFNLGELNTLANLPSRNELLSKMLGSFKSPTTGFVNVLAAVPRSLLNVLNAIKEKKSN